MLVFCRTSWSLRDIEAASDGNYKLLYDTPDGIHELRAKSVALTVPAYVAADLVRRESPDAAQLLRDIDYPPVAAVSLAYPKSSLLESRLDGNGVLQGDIIALLSPHIRYNLSFQGIVLIHLAVQPHM